MQINENDIARMVQAVLGEMTAEKTDAPAPKPQAVPQGDGKKIPTYASFMSGEPKPAAKPCACKMASGAPGMAKVAVLTAKEKL